MEKLATLTRMRLGAFVAERHPLALAEALDAFVAVDAERMAATEAGIDALRLPFRDELARRLQARPLPAALPETTPGTTADRRMDRARAQVLGFLPAFRFTFDAAAIVCGTAALLSLRPGRRSGAHATNPEA